MSVAEDVSGPDRPRVFAEGYPFPTVVDSQAVLGRLLDFDAVPNGVLIDPEGRIVFQLMGGFDVRREEVRVRLEGLLDELTGRAPPGATPELPNRPLEVELLLTEIAGSPEDADLRLSLAEAHARDGDAAAALEAYDQAIRLDDSSSAAHFGRGTALMHLGRSTEAEAAWKRGLELDPANFVIRKQIWAHRRPDRFYPEIDFAWQQAEMAREQAGESDLPPRPT